ncbi:hypothetical protein [Kitasatospora sp. HPMI-4]|uniref:hypothetical protein n=1 Tax=Kitasatospora sp. HPMI-4 TaxID=3448443 RepID=UPI003F1CD32E
MRPSLPARLAAVAVILATATGIAITTATLVDPQQHGTRTLVGLLAAATAILCAVPLYGAWIARCRRRALQQP